jgi:hypothetical protein
MGPTLAAAADTCVAQAANRRRAPNTRSSLSWPVEVLLAEADLEVLLGRDGLVQFRRVLSQVAVLPTG